MDKFLKKEQQERNKLFRKTKYAFSTVSIPVYGSLIGEQKSKFSTLRQQYERQRLEDYNSLKEQLQAEEENFAYFPPEEYQPWYDEESGYSSDAPAFVEREFEDPPSSSAGTASNTRQIQTGTRKKPKSKTTPLHPTRRSRRVEGRPPTAR